MRKLLMLIVFFLASVIDVQVRAKIFSQPRDQDVLEEPVGCDTQSSICSYKTSRGRKFELSISHTNLMMGEDTILTRLGSDKFTLLEGEVWVKSNGSMNFLSEYGEVDLTDSEVWIIRKKNRILFRTLNGQVELSPRGATDKLVLPAGFENWLGPVGKAKTATTGFPTAIEFKDHASRWAKVYPGTRVAFRKDLGKFRVVWLEALKSTRELHEEVASRTIAEAENERQRREVAKKRYDAETNKIREMVKDRLYR